MLAWLLGKATLIFQFLTRKHTPRQKIAGIAIGLWIGVVPKENLTAAGLMTLMLASRASIPHGLLTSIIVAAVASFGDPLFDRVGHLLLANESLQAFWQTTFSLPLMHWTRLNNTVVLGSFALGGVGALGTYNTLRRIIRDNDQSENADHTADAVSADEMSNETIRVQDKSASAEDDKTEQDQGQDVVRVDQGDRETNAVVPSANSEEDDIKARILAFAGTGDGEERHASKLKPKKATVDEMVAEPEPEAEPELEVGSEFETEPELERLPPIQFSDSIELASDAPKLELPDFDNVDLNSRKEAS